MTIYTFPPAAIRSIEWSVEQPIRVSRSMLTGRRYASAHQRERRVARFSVSARNTPGAQGRMEAIKRLIAGGANYVRFGYTAWTDVTSRLPNLGAVTWTYGGNPVTWTYGGNPVTWSYQTINGEPTTSGGLPAISITSAAASTIIARAGEFVEWGGDTRMFIEDVTTNASGAAVARLASAFSGNGVLPIEIGAEDSAVFEVTEIPSAARPIGADFYYDWSLREVFSDEIGAQSEINPWA